MNWTEHRPHGFEHVVGVFTQPDEDGEGQRWSARCTICGDEYGPAPCTSGRVRERIDIFGKLHAICSHLKEHTECR